MTFLRMGKLRSFFLLIHQDLWVRYTNIIKMEKEFMQCSKYLEPGGYDCMFSSSSLAVFHHKDLKNLPSALEETLKNFWNKPNLKHDSLYKRFIELIWKVLNFIRYKFFKRLTIQKIIPSKNSGIQPSKSQIITVRPNGKILLFDIRKNLVYTKYIKASEKKGMNYFNSTEIKSFQKHRSQIGKNFTIPADYDFFDKFHCQQLINSDKGFGQCNEQERLSIIRSIFQSCIQSSKEYSSCKIKSKELLIRGFSLIEDSDSNSLFTKYVNSRQKMLLDSSKNWKIISGHYDLTAHNLTVLNKAPVLLDLAPHKLGLLPAFLMPICLIHSELKEYNRNDLAMAFWEGQFDNELKELYSNTTFNKEVRNDIFLAESITLLSLGSKINHNSIESWFRPILEEVSLT